MLTSEYMEGLRQLAEGVSSTLKNDEKEYYGHAAHMFIESLHDTGCDDETASRVARVIALMMVAISRASVREVFDLLDANLIGYVLASASLAGVYDLPPREEGDRLPVKPVTVPRGNTQADIGMYL